ncbi:MAG TPA: hypothetical protein VMF89_12850, partial [Polyangiales bacterium]|nr:hypothetical protein [Polyangiales bacterium]
MTTRSTTLVESDQLAQAAANVLQTEDFIPRGKRWPFSRVSKAHRDYEKAVQDITARRRKAREDALSKRTNKERAEVDSVFQTAEQSARGKHDEDLSQAKQPYEAVESKARAERDAAIAAANRAYQLLVEEADRVYQQEASALSARRDEAITAARNIRDEAYASVEERHRADMVQIDKELKTVALEGLMRIVEDREVWSPEDRKKALVGMIGMAGREDVDAEYATLSLQNVAGYIFQDRYLPEGAHHHKLMDVSVLEGFVELAQRCPEKRPTIVKHLHDIVQHNPGHSSTAFIKNLTALYVVTSTDPDTVYSNDPVENETHYAEMLSHIADTLKLTPRRNQVHRG